MPRVKIDYVVSFSSEDPISSVQIGAHSAALVEVLVGRSETPNEPFQVLVPSSVFLSPAESRGCSGRGGPAWGAGAGARVRSFAGAALAAAAAHRWDRVRVVCSQPYNKHCQYGISFIHIFEPDGESAPVPAAPAPAPAPAPAVPVRLLALDTFSSDEEDFRPGELFAKHRQSGAGAGRDTGAQIRQATSQALNNDPEAAAATKLIKTSLTKNKTTRDKDELLYTADDERPHAKIDRIVQRHKDEKCKDEARTPKPKLEDKADKTPRSKREDTSSGRSVDGKRDRDNRDGTRGGNKKQADGSVASSSRKKDESRKRPQPDRDRTGRKENAGDSSLQAGPESDEPLRDVVFVLSGYQNPQRAQLRELALSLGARCQREWGPGCTHLVCAFSKTPKLAEVRALGGAGGAPVPAPTGEWVRECGRRRRALPWQWFAAEPAHRLPAPAPGRQRPQRPDSEGDTDDDIEEVLRQQKKARASPSPQPKSPSPSPRASGGCKGSEDSDDVEFVKDERMQANITVEDSDDSEGAEGDTDVEEAPEEVGGVEGGPGALPALFSGRAFVVEQARAAPLDARLLRRYCIAYGGLVLKPSEVDEDSDDRYVLCGCSGAAPEEGRGARAVRGEWVWACHAARRLLPLDHCTC